MKNYFSSIIIILVVFGFIGLGIAGGIADGKAAKERWNNGICELCGGAYQFSSASHVHNGGDRFYYTCEDCGHTIITYSLMK